MPPNKDFGPQEASTLGSKNQADTIIPYHPSDKEWEQCEHCSYEQEAGFTFCVSCGQRHAQITKKEVESRNSYQHSLRFLAYYGIYFAALIVVNSILEASYKNDFVISLVDALISLLFFFSLKDLWRIILPQKLHKNSLFLVLIIGLISPLVVSRSINYISEAFGLYEYSLIHYDAPNPLLYSLISVAVFPAIFEELTFRGFIYHHFEKIGNPKMALWASSVLFAMAHISVISLFWLLPFGLILAYLRQKQNTLIYGMILHFMHNAGVLLIEWNG